MMNRPGITRAEQASALIVTMFVIFLIAVSVGIAMNLTTTTFRQTGGSRDLTALRDSAEGALEYGYGIWTKEINGVYKPVANSVLTTALGTPPAFSGFSYATTLQVIGTDQYGRPTASATAASTPPPVSINLDNYPGWVGTNSSYVANVRMSGTSNGGRPISYGVKRSINYTVVPLFQATAFFEDDLELFRPATMTIGGLVHTNSNAYVSSSNAGVLTFTGHLSYSATNGYLDTTDPPQSNTWSGWQPNSEIPPTYSGGGQAQQVDQVNRIEPLGSDSATLLHPPVNPQGVSTGDTNPNDDSMRELIEPPDTYVDPQTQKITTAAPATDPQTIADRRLYNKAGIRIRASGSTYTVTTANGTSLNAPQITDLKAALSQQTIYDKREGKYVDLTTLDISQAMVNGVAPSALTDATFNNILYIDDLDSTGYADPQGIRLKNGSVLPTGGLTVASQNPIYIQGDYNTGSAITRGAAAVFADSVTILSNAWDDSNSAASLSSRNASNTTVNTAIVAGFIPSGFVDPKTGTQYGYSGGLNNFPRFLEDWSGNTFTYTGSMIELFTSQIATGEWDTGNIYIPPTRNWNFDSNFVGNPPPGSLDAVTLARGPLVRY
ncbi:MAG: hypothetical protein H0X40_07415 [Chthoniobacterales bacterium]|nr:hypothetical protein [Chthoniobacterales bacterium]